jgi:hypothetical protein
MTHEPSQHSGSTPLASIPSTLASDLREDLSASFETIERLRRACEESIARLGTNFEYFDAHGLGALSQYAHAYGEAITALVAGDTPSFRAAVSYALSCTMVASSLMKQSIGDTHFHDDPNSVARDPREQLGHMMTDAVSVLIGCASVGRVMGHGTQTILSGNGQMEKDWTAVIKHLEEVNTPATRAES